MSIRIGGTQGESKTVVRLAIAGLYHNEIDFDLLIPTRDGTAVNVYPRDRYGEALGMLDHFVVFEGEPDWKRKWDQRVQEVWKELEWIETCEKVLAAGESLNPSKGKNFSWYLWLADENRYDNYKKYFVWIEKMEISDGNLVLPAIG